MSAIGSCGCEKESLDDFTDLCIKEYARDCERCLSFGCYCTECATELEQLGRVLHNEQEQDDWLSGKCSYHN
jgi:hypothetical protein